MNYLFKVYNYLRSVTIPRDTYYSLILLAVTHEERDLLQQLSHTYESEFSLRACQLAIDMGKLHLIDLFIDKLNDEQKQILYESIV